MNRRYEHDPQPGELPEELKPRQKLDPVSEAIATEMERLTDLGLGGGGEHVVQGALHHIATLSYARGVEDSAMVVDSYRGKGAFDLRSIVAAIRKLIPSEKKA